jgi:peptide/nickel transport system substrate-binding protein
MGLRKISPLNILPRKRDYPHPYIPELIEELRRNRVSRREFLRTSTLLGLSATAAYAIAGRITGQPLTPTAHAQAGKGGVLKVGMRVQEMTDPATFDWTQKSNVARQMIEYLAITGPDNVTRPYLAEKWTASPDLKTWTFHLRKGITWSNGDPFTADDVAFNFRRWLDPKTGSSNMGLFASMTDEITGADGKKTKKMTEGAVEKVDAHTVRLRLNRPELAIPENCYNYPAAIVHRSFEEWGKDLSKKPVGTGPYELVEFKVGERAVLRKRKAPYWGGDVSLDEMHFIDLGDDLNALVGALASGQINYTWELGMAQLDVVKSLPGTQLFEAVTAQTAVARTQVTQKPFDDKRVRQALQVCINHKQVLDLAYRGKGVVGEDHHVAPIHPEYFKLPATKPPDIDKAKALLKEAGHGSGLQLAIDCNNAAKWEVDAVQAMVEMWKPAGINVKINVLPGTQFWENWQKTPFGMTTWTHRPLGVMVLNLAYRTGVPWNESKYNNPAFDKALDEASGALDVTERRKKMERVQKILQDDAVIMQPLWRSIFTAGSTKVHNLKQHPTNYYQLNQVWVG